MIRNETEQDIPAIHQLVKVAFLNAPHTDYTEQFIVDALRASGALSVSLVAEHDSSLIGYVAVSPVVISDDSAGWYGLGPIAVLPEHQGQGVGAQLMQAALTALKALNASGCVLLGDPTYYKKFGFSAQSGLLLPGVQEEFFHAVSFTGIYPKGSVTYHAAFSSVE